MKLKYLWVDSYKNLHNCRITFPHHFLLNAIIGSNGSGKSNLIEAILHILIGVYFKKSPPFDFEFQFEAQNRQVTLAGKKRRLSVFVDGEQKPIKYFADRLRDGMSQVYYPELTLVYYSGECQRVRSLINRYQRHFQRLTSKPESDKYRPLFVQSSNQQSQVILLALFAHRHEAFLKLLGLTGVLNISLVVRSPDGFDSKQHEPKLWNTTGQERRILAAIEETASSQNNSRSSYSDVNESVESGCYHETRTYHFREDSFLKLAERLSASGDNFYLAIEHLRVRRIFSSVEFQLKGRNEIDAFNFDQLSEGEKQLVAVIGAIRLTNQKDNLVLLDEPDTHLNPHWSWEYEEMLTDAFDGDQGRNSSTLLATHDPVMISGLLKEQVFLAHKPTLNAQVFTNPVRNPRGQGVANLLCSSEFFGLPSSLDKGTQRLLDERLAISVKTDLSPADKKRLQVLNYQLEIITPGVSERDPKYVEFLRSKDS